MWRGIPRRACRLGRTIARSARPSISPGISLQSTRAWASAAFYVPRRPHLLMSHGRFPTSPPTICQLSVSTIKR
ncbi:hypothetical protein BDZ89DRAFT_258959 [Hymenopellis radicata]|nr:hypothetical protein BDZ89DRAFT_258959 [Hymenopellis radicata]